jgi:tetratricopeptide (TPR) repeat protein
MALSPQDLDAVRDLCAERRFDAAVKLCADFIAEHPDHPHGYHMRAVVRVLAGEPLLALADRDKVVSLCPREPGAYLARADDQLRLGDFAAAAADLDRAEKLDQGHYWPMIPLLRGVCLARLGQTAAARVQALRVPEDYLLPGFGTELPGSRHALLMEIASREAEQATEPE